MTLKYRELIANIKASNVDIGDTGIKFYTEDDGNAAIGISIRHNKTPYDLTTNNMTPQLHLFLQDGSIILNEPVKIISGEKGIIEYRVTEKVIKHSGKAFAKLILQGKPNEQGVSESVHALNFRFEILDSGIEEAIEKVIDVKLLSEIFEEFALAHPEFITGLQQNVYTIRDGYWYLDGVNTNILADVSKFKHTHPISEVTNLQTVLDGKASQSHVLDAASHVSPTDRKMWDSKISQTSADARYVQQTNAFTQNQADSLYLKKTDQLNLSEYTKTIDADKKYAPKSHVHSTSDISDFSVEMAKKADKVHNHDGVYSKVGDSYTKVESDGKYTTKSHTHQISDVTNLQSSLDSKSSSTHNHDAVYSKLGHSHAISDVTDLQTTLDGKALAGHNHDLTYMKVGASYTKSESDNKYALKGETSTGTVDMTGYDKTTVLDTKYAPISHTHSEYLTKTQGDSNYASKTHTHTATDIGTYTKEEIDNKITTAQTGGSVDLSAYLKSADASTTYAPKSHTHTIANITDLQSTLDTKLTKTVADGLYAPIGSGSGGTVVVGGNVINANKRWGFVGDGTTDNYQAFKDMLTFVNSAAGQGAEIEWDGTYNGQQAQYRVARYVTISTIDASYASGSPTHMIWKGKNIKLKTNGAKFINMPMNGFTKTKAFTAGDGSWHYAKEEPITLFNFENCDGVIADSIFVDGENHKIKYATGFTSKENDNPRWTDNKPLAEGRGHGVVFAGSKNVHIENLKSINQAVDGVAIAFSADYGTMKVEQTTSFNIVNLVATGNGRLGVSGLGCHGGEITNLVAEYNGTNKNADGHYIYFSPAGGIDVEPHHSPIAMDNTSPTSYKVEDWNGSMAIKNARIRYNSGTQIACTSTLLTRSVIFERCVVRPPKNRTVDHQLIQSSLQNCRFIDMDVDGKLADGALSRVMFYGAGYVSESTGVITGQAANVWSEIKGGKWANIEPWVNTDGNTTYNEIPTGQYGLHNIVFADLVMENVRFTLRTIRRFVFRNVVMNYPSDSAITKLYMWNANMKDVVMLNRKSSNITLDLGTGDSQSNFENLRITTGRFDWVSGTKKYKTATIGSESLDVYDYTRAMEYILGNGTTPTPPTDTTPPNAPTVNTIYSDSSTITGTAEANSTVLFTGGFTGQTTANSSGSYTIVASGLTAGQTITVKAKDAAGNISTGTTVTVQSPSSASQTATPTINPYKVGDMYLAGNAEANANITATFNGGNTQTTTTTSSGYWQINVTSLGLTSGTTINVTAKSSTKTVSSAATTVVQPASSTPDPTPTGNLWATTAFNFTNKSIPQAGGSGSKLAINSTFTVSNNEAHTLDMTGSGDTITMASQPDRTKYGFFTLEPNTQYTVRIKATDTISSASNPVTMITRNNWTSAPNYIIPSPKTVDITFTTDSAGKWGYDFNGVTYGDASGFIFHRSNGGTPSTTTYKIWLNKGNTSNAAWS